MPIAVAVTDLSVLAMDEQLGMLVRCDLAGDGNCFCLRIVTRGDSFTALATNGPLPVMSNNVIPSHSFLLLLELVPLGAGTSAMTISAISGIKMR